MIKSMHIRTSTGETSGLKLLSLYLIADSDLLLVFFNLNMSGTENPFQNF